MMNLLHLNPRQALALRALRRRAWLAIALCLLLRLGSAALAADSPADIPAHLFSSERN
jgi:hypothetical protein